MKLLYSELLKYKHSMVLSLFIVAPLALLLCLLSYYQISYWDVVEKTTVYFELVSITLPFIIGVVCSIVCDIEYGASNYQLMLGVVCSRLKTYTVKIVFLMMMTLFALSISVFGFYIFYQVYEFGFYLKMLFVLLLTSLPLYIVSFYLGCRFGKIGSIGIGIIGSLISALFLTGLGDVLWIYFPYSWGARLCDVLILSKINNVIFQSYKIILYKELLVVLSVSLLIVGASILWFNHWEGSNRSE